MVGLSDVFWVYQNSGPALLFVLLAGGAYVWRHDLQPRLQELEQVQEDRRDRWQDQELNAQERALLVDNAQERLDQVDQAIERLKRRVRSIEQNYAVDHGAVPEDYSARTDSSNSQDGESSGGDD